MDAYLREILWGQFGAAIDTLDRAVAACPEDLWDDRGRRPEFWYVVYHTLFYLDLYVSGSAEGFSPPAPFTLDELDPAGVMPPRAYTKRELQAYLRHGRAKCRAAIMGLTDEGARRRCAFAWGDEFGYAELLLYNMRHVQHHAAQLNLLLRQATASAPGWVTRAED